MTDKTTHTHTLKFYEDYQSLKDGIEKIAKSETAGQGNFAYNYADLLAVKNQTDELIKDNGFILLQTVKESLGNYSRKHTKPLKENKALTDKVEIIEMNTSGYNLVSKLIHKESGESLRSELPLYCDDIDPQSLGSAITYMRRYSLFVLLDIKTEDDDGAKASNKAKSYAKKDEKPKLPEDCREWVEFLKAQPKPTVYYHEIKGSGAPKEYIQAANDIMYPKN